MDERKWLEREPTEEMMEAGDFTIVRTAAAIWPRMWDAAPARAVDQEAVRLAKRQVEHCDRWHKDPTTNPCPGTYCVVARALLTGAERNAAATQGDADEGSLPERGNVPVAAAPSSAPPAAVAGTPRVDAFLKKQPQQGEAHELMPTLYSLIRLARRLERELGELEKRLARYSKLDAEIDNYFHGGGEVQSIITAMEECKRRPATPEK